MPPWTWGSQTCAHTTWPSQHRRECSLRSRAATKVRQQNSDPLVSRRAAQQNSTPLEGGLQPQGEMSDARSKWRSVTEIVAALSVIIGLLLVVVEIRDNTSVSRAEARRDASAANIEFLMQIAMDPDLNHIWAEEWTEEYVASLSAEDRFRLTYYTLRPFQPLFGLQSRFGSPSQSIFPHFWSSGNNYQLF